MALPQQRRRLDSCRLYHRPKPFVSSSSLPSRSSPTDAPRSLTGILLRLTLPPVFLLASTSYFLPNSWRLISARLGIPEQYRDVKGWVDAQAGKVENVKREVEEKRRV